MSPSRHNLVYESEARRESPAVLLRAIWTIALVSALALLTRPGLAAVADTPARDAPQAASKRQTVVTHHKILIGKRALRYTATAGIIDLTNRKDEAAAGVFYVAYTADDVGPSGRRPITFAYNGGPGASSALIQLGALGPRTIVTTNAATTPPPPYDLVDNPDTLLDTSDLVFVDAVGTGYSRFTGVGTSKDFFGIDQDGRAFEQFIRRYITINSRWNSPKYLAGESYGTLRSVVLAKMLQSDGIVLTGITLISTVLDFSTIIAQPGNDAPYWLYLPTEAAVAAFHRRLPTIPADLTAFLQTVRAFAQGPYQQALSKGAGLPDSERDAVAQQLHADMGLPVDYLVRSRLRVPPERFEKQLLSGTNETVGRYDGRFREFDLDPAVDRAERDPSSDAVFGAFTAAFNRYIHDELRWQSNAVYEFLSADVSRHWQWDRDDDSPVGVNVGADLREVMTANPYLRVFSANGIYDLATPFFATEYSLAHLGIDPALQAHISYGYYSAGHMIYLNEEARAALKADLVRFYH